MKKKMKVKSLKIKNLLGIEEFSVDAGMVTVLKGKNAAGKTSVLTALQRVFGGGNLVELKNINSEESPEVAMVIDGDDEGTYLVERKGKSVNVKRQIGKTAAFKTVKAPQTFIRDLIDSKLSNPVAFVSASKKEQVDMLLGAADLSFDRTEFWSKIGLEKSRFPAIPETDNPIVEIDFTREAIFNERTGINRDLRQKNDAIEQLKRSIPAEITEPEDVVALSEEKSNLEVEYNQLYSAAQSKMQEEKHKLSLERSNELAQIKDKLRIAEEEIMREAHEKIAKIRSDAEIKIENINYYVDESTKSIESSYQDDIFAIQSLTPKIDELTSRIAAAKSDAKNATRFKTLMEQCEKYEEEAEGLQSFSDLHTEALSAVDKYKADILSNLPIDGLQIVDGKILVHGVKWQQLNTATQMKIATKIACERAVKNRLPIIWIDGVESCDSESFEALRRTVEDYNVQAFMSRVTDDDFKVEK